MSEIERVARKWNISRTKGCFGGNETRFGIWERMHELRIAMFNNNINMAKVSRHRRQILLFRAAIRVPPSTMKLTIDFCLAAFQKHPNLEISTHEQLNAMFRWSRYRVIFERSLPSSEEEGVCDYKRVNVERKDLLDHEKFHRRRQRILFCEYLKARRNFVAPRNWRRFLFWGVDTTGN